MIIIYLLVIVSDHVLLQVIASNCWMQLNALLKTEKVSFGDHFWTVRKLMISSIPIEWSHFAITYLLNFGPIFDDTLHTQSVEVSDAKPTLI